MRRNSFAILGALLAGLGVLMGAYHAHGLEKWLTNTGLEGPEIEHRLDNAAIAVRYQMYHALALLVLGLQFASKPSRGFAAGCLLLLIGVCLFSGGLYVIVFAGSVIHWSIVPLGGVTMIAGWLVVAVALCFTRRD